MWRPWAKPTVKHLDSSSSPSSPSPILFTCSSFKDIHHLCTEDSSAPSSSYSNTSSSSSSSKRVANVFHRVRIANSFARSLSTHYAHKAVSEQSRERKPLVTESKAASGYKPESESEFHFKPNEVSSNSEQGILIPGAEKRIVVYFTSLRVVRSTFEDCSSVVTILRGFRVAVDERDLAMDSTFLTELQGILGGQTKLTLPRVFIGGRYIGGGEEIRQLNETGELKKLVQGLPVVEHGVCDTCGDYKFILCNDCQGSHKLYWDKSGFKACTICNENGLIRCPSCSCGPLCSI